MKTKYRAVGFLGLGIALVCAAVVFWPIRRHVPQAGNQLTAEELREIQKVVRHDRWGIARSLVFRRQFLKAFAVCASTGVQKIAADQFPKARPDGSIAFVKGASVECGGGFQQNALKYELESTTDGHWKVVVVAFPKPPNPSNNRVRRAPL